MPDPRTEAINAAQADRTRRALAADDLRRMAEGKRRAADVAAARIGAVESQRMHRGDVRGPAMGPAAMAEMRASHDQDESLREAMLFESEAARQDPRTLEPAGVSLPFPQKIRDLDGGYEATIHRDHLGRQIYDTTLIEGRDRQPLPKGVENEMRRKALAMLIDLYSKGSL